MKKLIFSIFLLITLGLSNKSFAQEEKSVSVTCRKYEQNGRYHNSDNGLMFNLYSGILNYRIKEDENGNKYIHLTCYKIYDMDESIGSDCFPAYQRNEPTKRRNVIGGKVYEFCTSLPMGEMLYFN
jgi:hypothetical protein